MLPAGSDGCVRCVLAWRAIPASYSRKSWITHKRDSTANSRVVDRQPEAANLTWRKGVNRITFALSTNHGRAWGVAARVHKNRT